MYGLNQGVLHEVLMTTEGSIAEVCHNQGTSCYGFVNDLACVIVSYVLTGTVQTRDRFNPMHAETFTDDNVRRATATIVQYLRPMCNKRKRASRLARISTYVNQSQVA
ncbi:MAG: hypothetical protein QG549_287 [Patescibacteria group bacterium]|nr:hypothetical protein [Patescibacteria group bacterium]